MTRHRLLIVAAAAALLLDSTCACAWDYSYQHHHYQNVIAPLDEALPNAQRTPGAIDPRVTQTNIHQTICRPGGYTGSVRPSESYTEDLKRKQVRLYGYANRHLGHYEEDHLVSLEIGGSPTSPENLWPEPHHTVGGWGSYTKDQLENRLHDLVCSGSLPLARAQSEEAGDWIAAYKQYVSATPQPQHSSRP